MSLHDENTHKDFKYLKEEPILEVKSGWRNDGGEVFAINDFRRGHIIKALTWASIMCRPRKVEELLLASVSSWASFSLERDSRRTKTHWLMKIKNIKGKNIKALIKISRDFHWHFGSRLIKL